MKPIFRIIKTELRLAPGKEEFRITTADGRTICFGDVVDKPHAVEVCHGKTGLRNAVENTKTVSDEL